MQQVNYKYCLYFLQHDRAQHMEIDNLIKDKLEEGMVRMSYVTLQQQLADVLAKGLISSIFHSQVGNGRHLFMSFRWNIEQ